MPFHLKSLDLAVYGEIWGLQNSALEVLDSAAKSKMWQQWASHLELVFLLVGIYLRDGWLLEHGLIKSFISKDDPGIDNGRLFESILMLSFNSTDAHLLLRNICHYAQKRSR